MNIKELGHVVLYVTNLKKLADFYRDTLGFHEVVRKGPMAVFSSGRTHHEMLLIEVGGAPPTLKLRRTQPGLYHIGFKVADSTKELKTVYRELKAKNVEILGTSDHTVSHSIYIVDPDGNELELYADVSDVWKKNPNAVIAPVKPLNLED